MSKTTPDKHERWNNLTDELYKVVVSYHKMQITRHQLKIVNARIRWVKRRKSF